MFAQYSLLLRHNLNYRNLWVGYVVSQLGDWFNLIASAALVANITDAGTALSYLFLARFLPQFFFSPFAGLLSDWYDRRVVMITADLARALTVLGFLFVREPNQLWLFYLLTILQFVLSSLFVPARSAVLANIVAPNELVTANALDSITWSTMLAIGAMLGGGATAAFGIETAFVLDALTFVVSAVFIWKIQLGAKTPTQKRPKGEGQGWFDLVEGVRYLGVRPILMGLALAKAGGSLVWGAINVLEVNYAEHIFPLDLFATVKGDVLALSLIYAVSGLGTGLGPIVIRHWLGDAPKRMLWGIGLGFVLLASGIWGLSAAPSLGIFLLWTVFRTVGAGTLWVFSAALLQMVVPDQVRGRVFAFEFAMLTLAQSLSIYWAGFAQDAWAWDIRQIAASMGVVGAAVAGFWFVFMWGTRKQLIQRETAV